jgi:mycothiol synthase
MTTIHRGFEIRRPAPEDIEAVLALIIANDIAEHGSPDYEIADLKADWADVNLQKDIWIAFDANKTLVAYAIVMDPWRSFQFEFYTHTEIDTGNLAGTLLAYCEARAKELLPTARKEVSPNAILFLTHENEKGHRIVESAGFKLSKYYYRMQKHTEKLPEDSIWPVHTELIEFNSNKHLEATHKFIYDTFDWPGRDNSPEFEKWKSFMTNPEIFISDLWYLLFHKDEIIGAALCFEFSDTGWVRQIGVKKTWRGKGIGNLLMNHAYHQFYLRGFNKVSLAVESDNPKAVAFYKAIGMYIERQHDEYEKALN